LVVVSLLAVAAYLEDPAPPLKPAPVVVMEARQQWTPAIVSSRWEYQQVHKDMRRKRVHNIFGVDGHQVGASLAGDALGGIRYRACSEGAVLIEYTNARVDSKASQYRYPRRIRARERRAEPFRGKDASLELSFRGRSPRGSLSEVAEI
jgi:hypothetical protein